MTNMMKYRQRPRASSGFSEKVGSLARRLLDLGILPAGLPL